MSNTERMMVRQRKWMLGLLGLFALGAGVVPYTKVFLGLLLGSAASFYNLWLLQRKTTEFTEAAAKKQKTRGIGSVSRFATALLAVIIALRFEDTFHMIAVIAGLITSYLIMVADFLIFERKKV